MQSFVSKKLKTPIKKKELNERTQKEVNAKMLVPEHKYAVSMFLATAGASGHLLGSDEKEIIYLVFGIIDLQNKEVSDHPKKKAPRVPLEKFLKNMFLANCERWTCVMEEARGERKRRLKSRIYQ